MSYKKTILTGTLLLTVSGFLSRMLGFYNRIFLADLIGARELGIYSLIFPVYALCFTLVCYGFETGISNMTSRYLAVGQRNNARKLLFYVSCISFTLGLFLCIILFIIARSLSRYLLNEPSCANALKIASLALPFVAVKSCIHGFYIGCGKSGVSAASQLIEQVFRVAGIYLLSVTVYAAVANVTLAVWGMVLGEVISCIYTAAAFLFTSLHSKQSSFCGQDEVLVPAGEMLNEFFRFSIPLTINRFSVTMVNSLEAVLIPLVLSTYYGSKDLALETYGILTGMAFPFLFFPAAITNSLSVMLLPAISASYKQKKMELIKRTISKSLHYCIMIGIFSSFSFLFYGNLLGEIVFHSELAGSYIYSFAALCPFIYASQTVVSILNGFGLTKKTMYHSLFCVAVRIFCIMVMIPKIGTAGYLYAMIIGYVLQLMLDLMSLLQVTFFRFSVEKTLLLPAALALSGGWLSQQVYSSLSMNASLPSLLVLGICGMGYAFLFAMLQLLIQYLT